MGKSHQRGWVEPRGKKWYGFFRQLVHDPIAGKDKQKKVRIIIGLKSKISRREAQNLLQREITKETGQIGEARVMQDSSVAFGWFVQNRYYPLKEATWKEETAKVKKMIIQRDLIDYFDEVPLGNLDKLSLQVHLNHLAKTRSKDRVLQIRAYIRDIFVEAVDRDFLTKDPARKVKVPAELRETDKTTLSWGQLQLALSKLPRRDRAIVELDMMNALRPGELFALKWRCFNPEERTMRLMETVYKGRLRPWGKTRKSLRVVHLSKAYARDLLLWKKECADTSPEAFIFPARGGGFIDADNYRKRILHKLARELKLPKLTFQVIRRTMATLAQKKGTVKEVQGYMRHARTATTTDAYMQQIPGTERALVEALSRELRKRPARRRATHRAMDSDLPQIAPQPEERDSVTC
jgi:integrase